MSNNRSGVSLNLAIANIVLFYLKNYALQYPYYFKRDNVTTRFHLFFGLHIVGAILRRDILHDWMLF
jgi:hypothetical protein